MTKISPKWQVDGAKLQISCETTKDMAKKMKINVSNPQLDVWNLNLNLNDNVNENENKTLRYEDETLTLTLTKTKRER